jgi:hypothetical protein
MPTPVEQPDRRSVQRKPGDAAPGTQGEERGRDCRRAVATIEDHRDLGK